MNRRDRAALIQRIAQRPFWVVHHCPRGIVAEPDRHTLTCHCGWVYDQADALLDTIDDFQARRAVAS